MKKLSFCILLGILLCGCKTKKEEIAFKNPSEKILFAIRDNAKKLLQDKRFHSVSIAVYKDGIEISEHFGELEIGKKNPPNDSTIYEIASVTKTFLGTLAAKAVLEKKIGLDDDIRQYLNEPYPNLEYQGKPITIKHLLTHTSGFPNFPIKGENKTEFFEGLKEIKIESLDYSYSNTAPELMAHILEKVYQTPYEELLEKFIFAPNQMTSTKFDLTEGEQLRLVKGYNDENELMPNFKRNLWGGTVGLHSTTPDLLKYMKLQLDETNPIIKESHTNFTDTPYGFSIGYHWNILNEDDTVIYRHHGGIFGMQNWFMIYPKYNMGISILSNASFDETGDILEDIAENIVEEIK
ncbi:serine hydrolase domain-containing protein [Flagellimonas sp.]|uniref:serine hydrolase domain-containing protein n=1 Tax=Flagellimonas sp. TaxID=2058762 RepID=UPI003B5999C3